MKTYEKYKDSGIEWIGDIPEHWDSLPLFSKMERRKEKNNDENEYDVLSLSYGRIVVRDVSNNFGLLPESFSTYQIVYPNDVILRPTDLQNDKRSLRIGRVRQKGIITSAYICLFPNKMIEPYAHYLLHAYDLMKVYYFIGTGVRQTLNFEDIKRLPIVVPTLPEQTTIADYLDEKTEQIDKLIANKGRLIKLLKEERTAIINQAVTKGINPNAKLKSSGIDWLGNIPEHWEVKRIKWLFQLSRGFDLSSHLFVSGDVPVYGSNGRIGYHNIATSKAPGITVGRSGSVGEVNFVNSDFWAHNTCLFVYKNFGNDWKYIYHFLKCLDLKSLSSGSAVGTLNRNYIHNVQTAFPKIEEQKEIVKFIESKTNEIDSTISKIEKEIELIKEYRTALISEVVTGKIKVTEN